MQTIFQNRTVLVILIAIFIIGLLIGNLPGLLRAFGLHGSYKGREFDLAGKRALIITTSQATLGENGKATGVYSSELTTPYYQFLDANMQVDVASIQGGVIPFEPMSLRWPLTTPEDRRSLADSDYQDKVTRSLNVSEIDFTQYDVIFLAGGWGAAYDLGTSDDLGQKISEAYAADVILGAVCHGPLGFLNAVDENGQSLVLGRRMTGVTDKQVEELGITMTPQHPENELRKAGALYESETAFRDLFASHVVVDGMIVTGQNQNDGYEAAQRIMELLEQ